MSDVWTTDNIPDLTGKVIIVTGANSGIGYEATKEFARNGAKTILACRSMDKAEQAVTQIRAEIPHALTEIMQLDLASLKSIRQFTDSFNSTYSRLDILVNNAGVGGFPYSLTEDGFETHLGVNHLGHFALTGLLLNLLLKTDNSRVVTTSSNSHRAGKMNFDNLMYEGGKDYSMIGAYSRSKLANLLFSYELQRRFEAKSASSISVAAHPGNSNTGIYTPISEKWYAKIFMPFVRLTMQSAFMGALPTIRAAVAPAKGSEYYGPSGLMEMRGHPVVVKSSAASYNAADAQTLWKISEKLTDVSFDFLQKQE